MQLRALGGLRLAGSTFQKPKPLLLLAYLLLEGPVERRHAAELFWPRAKDHLNSLSQALSQLRRAVPGSLQLDGDRCGASLPSDVGAVLDALEQGALEVAVERYSAPLLEGVFLPGWGAELEEWVYGAREALAGRVRRAYLELAEAAADESRVSDAVRHAESAYSLPAAPPLASGEIVRLHRILQWGDGARLPELRRAAREIGVSLDDVRRRDVHDDRAGVPVVASPPLPAGRTAFVGRELEIAEVGAMLLHDTCRLVTIVGQGGIGKTRLALEVADRMARAGAYRDGVFFVPLEAVADPHAVMQKVAVAVGLPLQGRDEPFVRVQRFLGSRRALLVLDNFEHLLSGAARVTELVSACPGVDVLVTSRERLHLEEEWLFTLGGLSYPERGATLEEARSFDAVRLFAERARRVQRAFALGEDAWKHVAHICDLVGGSPLAIELAASWVHAVALGDIAREIEAGTELLHTRARNVPRRHRSIRAAFEHSWSLLGAAERVGLCRLAAFRGGFTAEAASRAVGVPLEVLVSLVDKSLVRGPRDGRYDLHPLLHAYAHEKLQERPTDAAEVRARHGAYYLDALLAWRQAGSYPSPESTGAIAQDLDNVLAAWRHAFASECEGVARIAEALTWFFEVRAQYREGVAELGAASEVVESRGGEPCHGAAGNLLVYRAWLGHWLENERADAWAERGLRILRPLGEVDGVVLGLRVRGIVAWRGGAYPEAEGIYREALDLARSHGAKTWEAVILDGLGLTLSCQGSYAEAERCHGTALEINLAVGNPFQRVHNLANLAALCRRADRRDDPRPRAMQALDLARRIGFAQYVPNCVLEVAKAHAGHGAHDEAESAAREAHTLATAIGDNWTQAGALLVLGRLGIESGELADAERLLERSAAIAWANVDVSMVLRCLYEAARLALARGERERAIEWLRGLEPHAALPHWTGRAVRERLAALEEELPSHVVERARGDGAGAGIEAILADALPGALRSEEGGRRIDR